ncbi:MAG: hypothetical protein AUG12_03755 [Acidobacteria bacterium 13_1_20CM_2_57_8]|nr:MAG: hypothetical protein AUG12_03755 [Acidobacteria bacterium 13_1_20CM_2_57_8]
MRRSWVVILLMVFGTLPVAGAQQPGAEPRVFITTYCVTCHNDRLKTGQLSLEKMDFDNIPAGAEVWEKVIRKLRASAMPPQTAPKRPDQAMADAFASYLETTIDRAAAAKPNPGHATLHRLNRTEYGNAVRDVLGLEIDPTPLLPADDESYGFDNIADVLKISPSLMQRYMSASWSISRLAVGNPAIVAETATYRAKPDLSQDGHIEGLPLGTRGGMSMRHNFPLDGEYEIRVRLWRATADVIKGLEDVNQLEVSVDGVRTRLITIGGPTDRDLSYENSGKSAEEIDKRLTVRVQVKAGPRTVIATFLKQSDAQADDVLQPYMRTNLDPLGYRGLPAVDRVSVAGPFKPTGAGDTPSRRQIFTCKPSSATEEPVCARQIISKLARKAYRRPVTQSDLDNLIGFYQRGRNEGGNFESGIEAAIQLLLASPDFLFRFEPDTANAAPGGVYRISDLDLASRLSFFLWSTIPDEELLSAAAQGLLKDPAVLERQVKRMLKDPRAKALVDNFAGQWLYLRNLKTINPDFETFPDFDDNLRQAMKKETDLFIESIIREDRSVMELLNANYTFVNERLARHYRMPGIYGTDFRRVTLKDDNRRGLLGQASILTLTSNSTRTSPVSRGKWILTNILGLPPNPPPPEIPALKEKSDAGKPTSLRERMEQHRANPTCAGCHRAMDPIGFSLENFDAVGQWRNTDEGVKIDPSGTLFNGTNVNGPVSLRQALASRPEIFTGVLTEKLMTYGLGRGIQYYDMPAVRSVLKSARPTDFRFSSMVLGIVKSVPFQMKTVQLKETN